MATSKDDILKAIEEMSVMELVELISDIEEKFRPGHADYTYFSKYGIRDVRGGGRQSARETAMRVAAGAIARKILPKVEIKGALVQLGEHKINRENWDDSFIEKNAFWSPDPTTI